MSYYKCNLFLLSHLFSNRKISYPLFCCLYLFKKKEKKKKKKKKEGCSLLLFFISFSFFFIILFYSFLFVFFLSHMNDDNVHFSTIDYSLFQILTKSKILTL